MSTLSAELVRQIETELATALVQPGEGDAGQRARQLIATRLEALEASERRAILARVARRQPAVPASPTLQVAAAPAEKASDDGAALKAATAKVASLERQLREAANREDKLKADLATQGQRLADVEGELDKRFTQLRNTQREHEQLTRQLDATRSQHEAATSELKLREQELYGLRQELDSRSKELRAKDERLTTIREERDAANKTNNELETQLNDLKKVAAGGPDPDSDPVRLREQLANAQKEIKQLKAAKEQAAPAPADPPPAPVASGEPAFLACEAFTRMLKERGVIAEDMELTPTSDREEQIGGMAALLATFLEDSSKVILSQIDDLHVRQPRLAELAMPITHYRQEFGERIVWELLSRPQSAYDDPVADLDTFLIPVRNLNICFLNAFQQVVVKHIRRIAHEELSPTKIGIAAKTRNAGRLWAHYESQVAQQAPSAIADQCLEEFVALADRFYRRAG